jgi:hypothetical protein
MNEKYIKYTIYFFTSCGVVPDIVVLKIGWLIIADIQITTNRQAEDVMMDYQRKMIRI